MQNSLILLVCCIAAFWAGWFWREIMVKVKEFTGFLRSLKDIPEEDVKVTLRSSIIEPRYETPSEKALREQKELTDSLNP